MIEQMPSGLIVIDQSGNLLMWNELARQIMGFLVETQTSPQSAAFWS
ncbi:MAG: PAS domain S-box protein [Desulfomonilaceae bacterium]